MHPVVFIHKLFNHCQQLAIHNTYYFTVDSKVLVPLVKLLASLTLPPLRLLLSSLLLLPAHSTHPYICYETHLLHTARTHSPTDVIYSTCQH